MIRIINPIRRRLPSIFPKGQGRLWPRLGPIAEMPKDERDPFVDEVHRHRNKIIAICTALGAAPAVLWGKDSAEAAYLPWADKVNYLLSSTSAARTVKDRLSDYPSILDFDKNAGTGGDDTATIAAALAYVISKGGGPLYFPGGNASYTGRTYRTSSTIQLSKTAPVQFIGSGQSYQAFGLQPASLITTIKWTGSGGSYVFSFDNITYGAGISNMTIDCNNSGTYANGVNIDTVVGLRMQQVMCIDFGTFGLYLIGNDQTCSWNHFEQTSWESLVSTNNIAIDRSLGAANCAHITFMQTKVVHAGTSEGIHIGGPDNIAFFFTFIYQAPGGSNYGVRIDPSVHAGFPGELTFYHLETQSGWYQPNTTTGIPAIIFALNQSPAPTLNGTHLTYLTGGGTSWTFA